jgi:hypothetical protein
MIGLFEREDLVDTLSNALLEPWESQTDKCMMQADQSAAILLGHAIALQDPATSLPASICMVHTLDV